MSNIDYNAMLNRMLAQVPDDIDKREGSIIYDALAPTAYMLAGQNFMLGYLTDLLFGNTATGEWLDRVVGDFGLTREVATYSVRQINCADSAGAAFAVPIGARFAIQELTFKITDEITVGSYKAVCEQLGTQGNCYSGAILPLDNIFGLGAAVLAVEPLIPARDEETDDALRARFYLSVRQTPFGGNKADYREKTMEIDGVGACVVFGAVDGMGAGNVGLIIGDEHQNRTSQTLVDEVQALYGTAGDGLAPIGHTVTVATCVDLAVNVSALLVLKSGTSIAVVQPLVETAIRNYIENIAFDSGVVFYAKLVAEVLGAHDAILDVGGVMMNGKAANIVLEKTFANYQVSTVGTITVTEVV
ncbi:baseplate J/gp47 family protein [Oscillospiraceae bacterium LTW-04]|nr:baseplate J/gp47 family protein [Oscillospiraceae bacterium MB24-C1]